ncbi:endoglucanase [Paramixta manurensis]|uniref:cellulase n=1 Tax=Paramixta manurensis TaxID=2740817 RepID=A0A6M8U332_9GAMM|nr:endoglucanase [Erwiniaceae bacterium PD-1]
MLILCSAQAAASDGWNRYKATFLSGDGRIVDTGNNNVSHTEGQGYAMLLAVHYDDRDSFARLWKWTSTHLSNPQNGLFYWRYDPAAANPVADKNNAADGDVLIAWALQRAGEKWNNADYLAQSDKLQRAIVAQDVVTYAGHTLMLPGAQGFNKTSYVILNPSYFIFPAWRDFARRSHLKVWNQLIDDGLDVLGEMQFGASQLPLDWVAMNADGSMAPATAWPPRFSYDAVRVPLYVWWYDAQSLRLTPFQRFWGNFSRLRTPAWIDVIANESAPYNMDGGLLAIRDLTLGDTGNLTESLSERQDYYSASLQLIVWMAWQER